MTPVRRRDLASISRSHVAEGWLHGVTQSEFDDDDIEIMRNPSIQPARKSHGWTTEEAIKFLIDAVDADQGSDDDEVLKQEHSHRFPYALFVDIDRHLFGGVLRGNVQLIFENNLSSGLAGITTRPSQYGKGRIKIELSGDLAFRQHQRTIVEVLLHQMIHAYLLQCCGARGDGSGGSGHDLKHGSGFSTAALVIIDACGFDFEGFPSLIGVIAQRRRSRSSSDLLLAVDQLEESRCCDEGVPSEECEERYEYVDANVEAPEINLDKQCPMDKQGVRRPITQYYHHYNNGRFQPALRSNNQLIDHVELHYNDRAILIPCTPWLKSLQAVKAAGGFPVLVMPFGVDEKTFGDVYRFLTTGFYMPPVVESQFGGPPTLSQGIGVGRAFCLRDIKAYRAGAALGLPELQEHALRRLWAHPTTWEDPVAALEWLYHGDPAQAYSTDGGGDKKSQDSSSKEKKSGKGKDKGKEKQGGGSGSGGGQTSNGSRPPDAALRTWARAFLARAHDEYGCTLDLLRRHASYRDAWNRLKARGGPLVVDVDAVDEEVMSRAVTGQSAGMLVRCGAGPRSRSWPRPQELEQDGAAVAPWLPAAAGCFPPRPGLAQAVAPVRGGLPCIESSSASEQISAPNGFRQAWGGGFVADPVGGTMTWSCGSQRQPRGPWWGY